MSNEPKVVAILTANVALSSIVHMVLSDHNQLRVREFESEELLSLYMHIAPVDLLICDYDQPGDEAFSLVGRLRAKDGLVRRDFQVIALSKTVNMQTKAACVGAGIDELIIKPMSPAYLETRVLARLSEGARHFTMGKTYTGPERRQKAQVRPTTGYFPGVGQGNVVPLFRNNHITGLPR